MPGWPGMARLMAAQTGGKKAQLSVEMVIIAAVMVSMLLVIYMVNANLNADWEAQKQLLSASAAANQLAFAINRAFAGGNGTQIFFLNSVGQGVLNVTLYSGRSVRAYTLAGYASSPVVTNMTQVNISIPINRPVRVYNDGEKIIIGAG